MNKKDKIQKHIKRKKRVRFKITGTKDKPRLSVFRSNKYIYCQLIDDMKGTTLVSVTEKEALDKGSKKSKETKLKTAFMVGEKLALKAKRKKIKKVTFDRGGYKYHGRVKALAEGARKGGLIF